MAAILLDSKGAQWQRCQTHFMRNILGVCTRHLRKYLANKLKLIFTAEFGLDLPNFIPIIVYNLYILCIGA